MADDIGIFTRLKNIALTSLALGRELARERLNQGRSQLEAGRLGALYRGARSRLGLEPVKPTRKAALRTSGARLART